MQNSSEIGIKTRSSKLILCRERNDAAVLVIVNYNISVKEPKAALFVEYYLKKRVSHPSASTTASRTSGHFSAHALIPIQSASLLSKGTIHHSGVLAL